ncbi:hypothetical protein ES706_03742 [subsurface metagenome]
MGKKGSRMITLEALKKEIDRRERELGRAKVVELREKYGVLKRLQDKTPKTKEDVVEAMRKILCFGSISFCCGSPKNPKGEGKACVFRDSFLDSLSLTWDDFERIKTKMEESFWDYLGGAVID